MAGFNGNNGGSVVGGVSKMTDAQRDAARSASHELAKVFELKPKTRGEGVLFDNDTRKDGSPLTDADPIQTGVLHFEMVTGDGEVVQVEVPLSGFAKTAESGTRYLSLSMGVEGGVHFYGKLFNQMSAPNRKENSPDYSGYLTVLPVRSGVEYSEEDWEAAPELQLWGRRDRAAGTNKPYIKLSVRPRRDTTPVADSEIKF